MSGTDNIRLILSKYNSFIEFVQSSAIVGPSVAGVWTVTIDEPYVVYPLDFFVFSSEKEITIRMYDSSNQPMFSEITRVPSLPLPFPFYNLIPRNRLFGSKNILGDFSTEGTFCVEFWNFSAVSADVSLGINCIFIPLSEADKFEAEIKLFDLGNVRLIEKLEELNKNIVSLKDRVKPKFVE